MNPNLSLHLNAGFSDQLHGCAPLFADEVFGETLYIHAAPIARAVRSYYKQTLRPDLEIPEFANAEEEVLASFLPTVHSGNPAETVETSEPEIHPAFLPENYSNFTPPTHWGINE